MNTLLAANIACLQQGMDFLGQLSPETYSRKCAEIFNSSIGGHIRHSLDHYLAFVEGALSGEIDYDDRKRETGIETDPKVAIQIMQALVAGLNGLGTAGKDFDQPVRIRMDDGGDSTWSKTTLRRELQFLLSHAIHHYALVVSIATRYGEMEFPPGFGMAPSTLHYMERKGA